MYQDNIILCHNISYILYEFSIFYSCNNSYLHFTINNIDKLFFNIKSIFNTIINNINN